MGEVYRANDTRLDRVVAIKVLPDNVSADPDRRARFEREAKAIAALSHANILAIFDTGVHDGQLFVVTELLEGESLRDRLTNGALPTRKAIDAAIQIARGLAAAHAKGLVHRDLKPENVFVLADGQVKIPDFGLARQVSSSEGTGATQTIAHTDPGTVMGTVGYMAPETVRGQAADARADLFAFAAVFYEMLSGRRAFQRDTAAETMTAILREEPPDLAMVRADLPPAIDRIVHHCLEKNVAERFQSARDIAFALEALSTPSGGSTSTAAVADADRPAAMRRGGWRDRAPWIGLSVTTLIALTLAIAHFRPSRPPAIGAHAVRLPFTPPDSVAADINYVTVSPDGQTVAFTGRAAGGTRQLWVRPLDSMDAQPLAETDDAIEPFWSPDSRSIGFASRGKLKRVDLAGGRPQTLSDAARLNGGTWSRTGVILFSPDYNAGLLQVPAAGGEPVLVGRPDPARAETGYANPVFLPDGRHFLYRAAAGGHFRVMAGSLDSKDVKPVLDDDGPAAYAPPGWLLYIRNGTLVAQAFDPDRLELGGEVVPITATPGNASLGAGRISVSESGVLILQNNINPSYDYQLVWFDRAGKQTGALGVPGKVTVGQFPQISPDGRRAVIQRVDPQTRNQDLWVIDLARQTFNRLTTNPAQEQLPVWSSDGTHVIFSRTGVYQVATSGGDETRLMEGTRFPHDVSPGGRFLIYLERGGKTRLDVWAAPLSGSGEPHVLLNSEFDEAEPQISPDGRWLAYVSDVTGSYEVYVQAFTAEAKLVGEKIRISTGGGVHPRRRRGGKELFYVAGTLSASDGQVMVVDWQMSGAVLESPLPKALFRTRMLPNQFQQDYDVTADGQRFLVGTLVGEASATPVSLVLNWTADVRK